MIDKFEGFLIDYWDLGLPDYMPFPHEKTDLITVDYSGLNFEPLLFLVGEDNYRNDTINLREFEATKKDWNDEELQKFCKWWLTGEKEYEVEYPEEIYFNLLATLGEIEEGKYLIRISW